MSAPVSPPEGMNSRRDLYSLTARRLLDKVSRDRIRSQNRQRNSKYPRHQAWIERALEALASDDYSRMAFGVYLHVEGSPPTLCCSVIVTVNAFAPHLELKNLTIFTNELPEQLTNDRSFDEREFESDCILTVLRHVQRFASDRGYRKLLMEVFRDDDQDRHVTQCFLERGFSVVGNQSGRYEYGNSVLYLAWNVFAAYGYDPFDYYAASRWVIEANLPDAKPSRSVDLRIDINGKSSSIRKAVQIFETGSASSPISKKLGDEVALVVVEDYLGTTNGISSVESIEFEGEFDGRLLLFDYSYDSSNWVRQLSGLLDARTGRFRNLDRAELIELLYQARDHNKAMKRLLSLPKYTEVGGLVALSDPQRFPIEKVRTIFRLGLDPIYIKLGPKGKFLIPGQHHILLSYFSESSARPEIWGIGEISEIGSIDLSRFDQSKPLADSLWDDFPLDGDGDGDHTAEPIWTKDVFEKHNRYNASNEVVCIYLKSFTLLNEARIPLSNFAPDPYRLDFLAREYDAYLTIEEVNTILSKVAMLARAGVKQLNGAAAASGGELVGLQRLGLDGSVRTACVHAYSNQDTRLDVDSHVIVEMLRGRAPFELPQVENHATQNSIKDLVRRVSPHILHVAAHGDDEGITVRDALGDAVRLGVKFWQRLIGLDGTDTQIVLLCCCESKALGSALSAGGRISISFDALVPDEEFSKFNEFFYRELTINPQATSALSVVKNILGNWTSAGNALVPILAFNGNII